MKEKNTSISKAVALNYESDRDQAPRIVAKGSGQVAENILNKAKEHGVPIQEDRSLVEVLSQFQLDSEIPAELYQVVAEILSFVYRSDRELGEKKRSMRNEV
jgi:flagellar biosynthesis protein